VGPDGPSKYIKKNIGLIIGHDVDCITYLFFQISMHPLPKIHFPFYSIHTRWILEAPLRTLFDIVPL